MQFLRHMKIGKKLTVAFSSLIALTIVTALVSFGAISEIKSADEAVNHARDMGNKYQSYQRSFAAQRQGLLYYLLTGDREGLKTYNEFGTKTAADFAQLKSLSERDEAVSKLVGTLGGYYQEWVARFASEQIDLMRNYLTVNQARAVEVTGLPREVIAAFDDTLIKLNAELEKTIKEALDHKASALNRLTMTVIVSIALIVLAALVLGFALTRAIAAPIARITQKMDELANGILDIHIQGADRRDEIGGMARAVEVFKENAINQKELQAKEAEAQELERQRHIKMEQLAESFDNKMASGLSVVTQSVAKVLTSASTMADNAMQTGSLSQDASMAIGEASTNIQTVSAASTQLSSSISEISHQMVHASEVSRAAVEEIERANQRVSALNEAAESIGQVVQIISDIAEQTNLLALNATIESARAGEAGKGFAVVASEVKNLANQTGKATEEISVKIKEIQSGSGAAAEAVLGVGDTIRKIDELTAVVASAVEEQGAATSEIARNVDEAAQGANQVSSVVVSVASAAEETGKLAAGQQEIVEELSRHNETLKADIDEFLSSVKTL